MKLYKRIVDLTMMDWEEATPDEIKEAHPKCGECRHIVYGISKYAEPHCKYRSAVDPTTDYCNKWEAK